MQDVEILSAVSHEFVHEGYVCPRCKATLEELPALGADILKGQVKGRVVVDVNA